MRSVSVDLNNDSSLLIDIPDALCERDKVKFTVHTKVRINPCMRDSFIQKDIFENAMQLFLNFGIVFFFF